jgi:hypothetical protein
MRLGRNVGHVILPDAFSRDNRSRSSRFVAQGSSDKAFVRQEEIYLKSYLNAVPFAAPAEDVNPAIQARPARRLKLTPQRRRTDRAMSTRWQIGTQLASFGSDHAVRRSRPSKNASGMSKARKSITSGTSFVAELAWERVGAQHA